MKAPRIHIQILLLTALVLAIYYPAIHSPLNPMDDRAIVNWLYNMNGEGIWEFFTHSTGNYFRPVLLTTYYLDLVLWGADPGFMHLENVLLHLANTLLLFIGARIAFKKLQQRATWLPFLAALLFAIHPVNTEAVNWIAGRSDLLACFFVLLAAVLLLLGISKERPLYALLSLFPLLPGALSKETAIFFAPAALVLILSDSGSLGKEDSGVMRQIRGRWRFLFPFLAIPLIYLVVRGEALFSGDAGFSLIGKFLNDRGVDLLSSAKTALTGLGFYGRKLVFPWPLNFTIYQVPEYHFWLGAFLLLFLFYCMWRRDLLGGLFLSSFCLGLSALLAMLLRPAWTPVAERYLYIPSTFFCLAAVIAGHRLISKVSFRRVVPMGIVLFFASTVYATFDRNLIWQSNIDLFEDAVRKSPDFPFARSVLADLLLEAGRVDEGKAMIRENTAPAGLRNADFLDLKRAQLLFSEGKYEESRDLIIEKRNKEGQLYHTFQKLLAKVDDALLEEQSGRRWKETFEEAVDVHLELFQAYHDPFYHYQLGKLYLRAKDFENASRYFRLASMAAPEQAHYKETAAKLAEDTRKR